MAKEAKKDFTKGLGGLLQKTTPEQEQPEPAPAPAASYTEKRATFIIREDLLNKINGIAFWESTLLKDQVNAALDAYIKEYEKVNGPVKLPKKKK